MLLKNNLVTWIHRRKEKRVKTNPATEKRKPTTTTLLLEEEALKYITANSNMGMH